MANVGDKQNFEVYFLRFFFLSISLNIYFVCSKKLSHRGFIMFASLNSTIIHAGIKRRQNSLNKKYFE